MALSAILDGIDDSELLSVLDSPYTTGHPSFFSGRALWRAYLCKFFLKIHCDRDLIDQLKVNGKLRRICGFSERTPSQPTFSRFVNLLSENSGLVLDCLDRLTSELQQLVPDLGDHVAIDSTDVRTCGNPNRKTLSDQQAKWGVKHSTRAKKDGEGGSKVKKDKTEYFFGYKLHTLADARYGIPLGFAFTPGNESDSRWLPEVVREVCGRQPWLKPKYLIADRGYDSNENHQFVYQQGINSIIHIRVSTEKKPLYDNTTGAPTCLGGKPMEYVGTDPDNGSHLFRCPAGGCELKQRGTKAVLHCQDGASEEPEKNLRVLGTVARQSNEWKSLYRLRWSIERLFSSLKRSRGLESHSYWDRDNIYLHATTSLLTWQATALARARAGDKKHLRRMGVRLA